MYNRRLQAKVKELLEASTVGYCIGWGATRFADRTTPVFITRPEDADKLVWNRYCVNGTAKYALDDRIPEQKIGIIVRGCDSRAVNRMIQDKQLQTGRSLYHRGPLRWKRKSRLRGLPAQKSAGVRCPHRTPVAEKLSIRIVSEK
ncbi:MAG: hypothetical protein V8R80_02530 [Eubacterium sp.]